MINLHGYHQSLLSFQDYYPAVCAALRPAAGVQQRTADYLRKVLATAVPPPPTANDAGESVRVVYKTVAVHVRRGDYAEHSNTLGLLTHTYYVQALVLIKERLLGAVVMPQQGARVVPHVHLHVVVFTAESSVAWCITSLAPRLRAVATTVACANTSDVVLGTPASRNAQDITHGTEVKTATQINRVRCQGEEIDLFAMSAFDFVVLANSTFSFWAQFFHTCRMRIVDWWSAATAMEMMTAAYGTVAVTFKRVQIGSMFLIMSFTQKSRHACDQVCFSSTLYPCVFTAPSECLHFL